MSFLHLFATVISNIVLDIIRGVQVIVGYVGYLFKWMFNFAAPKSGTNKEAYPSTKKRTYSGNDWGGLSDHPFLPSEDLPEASLFDIAAMNRHERERQSMESRLRQRHLEENAQFQRKQKHQGRKLHV